VVTAVSIFLDITFEEATVYYGNRVLTAGDIGGLRALMAMSLKLDIAVGVVVSAAIFFLAAPLAQVASAGSLDPDLVRIVSISALVLTADTTAYAALALVRRVDLRARATAATSLFRLLGIIVAVALDGGAEAVAVSYVIGGAAGSVVLGRLAWRTAWQQWRGAPPARVSPVTAGTLTRFAFHTSLATSVQSVSGTLVPVILARASGTAAVGIFRVALLPVVASQNLSGPLRLAIFPEQARLVAERRTADIRKATRGYTVIALGLGIVGAAIAWVAMPWLIPLLYSSSFDASVTPARILLIAAVVSFAFGWRKSLLAAIGRPDIRSRLSILSMVVTVSVLLVLADRGAEGAAIAVTAGTVSTALAWLLIARRVLSDESVDATRQARAEARSRERPPRLPPSPEQDPSGVAR